MPGHTTISLKVEVFERLKELKERKGFRSYSELIAHLIDHYENSGHDEIAKRIEKIEKDVEEIKDALKMMFLES